MERHKGRDEEVSSLPGGSQPSAGVLAELDSAFIERVVTVDETGARVACRSGGAQGPVIVLLHGISSGAASWLPCASLLAAGARVIAWDAPGYGNSTPLPSASPTAADYAARLQALLRALRVKPDLIVGHSLGALMASAHAAHAESALQPDRYLLISPALGYGGPDKAAKAAAVASQRLEALTQLGVDGLAQRGPVRLLSPRASADAQAWVRWNMRRLNADGYRQAVAMLCGDDIDRYLATAIDAGRAAATIGVACGALDVVTTPPATAALAERFGLSFHLIPDAGHACYIEQAHATARLIRAALAS